MRDVRQVLREESGEVVGIKNEEQHSSYTVSWSRRLFIWVEAPMKTNINLVMHGSNVIPAIISIGSGDSDTVECWLSAIAPISIGGEREDIVKIKSYPAMQRGLLMWKPTWLSPWSAV
jgi:hypothetical protein